MTAKRCHCGALQPFEMCCEPLLKNNRIATSALQLMRSRYSAYVTHNATYLVATTIPNARAKHSFNDILQWAKNNTWLRLEIIDYADTVVTFKAYYRDEYNVRHVHYERSSFTNNNGNWFYENGIFFD